MHAPSGSDSGWFPRVVGQWIRPQSYVKPALLTLAAMLGQVEMCPAATTVSDVDREKIETALPAKAPATPRKARRLLIFDRNVNYGGHASIPIANLAFTRMGEKTGAFETEISTDPNVFRPDSLRRFDAVFFNNNVGNLFEDAGLRESLAEFVFAGGGIMGVHGATVAFTRWPGAVEDWPEFGLMIGARGANHKSSTERIIFKFDDPGHPLNQPLAQGEFEYRDEFFRVHEPYSRQRLRVLFSIDTVKTDMNQSPTYGQLGRPDNDYALAWTRQYGRGRSFYCTIAHNPYVFWDAKMLQFYLGAVQFVLGDLDAPTTPSARLTPALRAAEKLGWRVGLLPDATLSVFQALDQASRAGASIAGLSAAQRLKPAQPTALDDDPLNPDQARELRLQCEAAGARPITYSVDRLPEDATRARRLFELARQMGVEALIVNSASESLDPIEQLTAEFDIKVALQVGKTAAEPPSVKELLKRCQGHTSRIGLAVETARWLNPDEGVSALKQIGHRLLVLELDHAAPRDVTERYLALLAALDVRPVLIAVSGPPERWPQRVSALNEIALQIADRTSHEQ